MGIYGWLCFYFSFFLYVLIDKSFNSCSLLSPSHSFLFKTLEYLYVRNISCLDHCHSHFNLAYHSLSSDVLFSLHLLYSCKSFLFKYRICLIILLPKFCIPSYPLLCSCYPTTNMLYTYFLCFVPAILFVIPCYRRNCSLNYSLI